MSERLTTAKDLKPGGVCLVAVELREKGGTGTYWWKRFTCVINVQRRHATMLTLKMHIDPDKDVRLVDFGTDVVTKIEPDAWPQGVVAMRMKWIARGLIKVSGED